jgi:hypothetical protein
LLFNANLAIFQLYHGENKLIFNEIMMTWISVYSIFSGLEPASQSVDPVKDLVARTTLLTLMEKKMQEVQRCLLDICI